MEVSAEGGRLGHPSLAVLHEFLVHEALQKQAEKFTHAQRLWQAYVESL